MKPGIRVKRHSLSRGIINLPTPGPGVSYGSDQGDDPILGPPYAPIVYQLFMGGRINYGTPNIPIWKTHLYWTVPSLNIQWAVNADPSRFYRVWFSTTSSPVAGLYVDLGNTSGGGGTTFKKTIYASVNVWVQIITTIGESPSIPGGGGTLITDGVHSGLNFSGYVQAFGAGPAVSFHYV